jgi:uncharacterized protein (DUF305 family)
MNSTKTRTGAIALAITAALVATGCGSDSHDGHEATKAPTTTSAAAAVSPAAVDKAFVAQMIPHHEMAIEMAGLAPAQGQHQDLRKLGKEILDTQALEITELRQIAKDLKVTPGTMKTDHAAMDHSAHGPTMTADAKTLGLSMDEMGMSMNMESLRTARPFDRAFIDMMIAHHQGAIRMARAQLEKGQNAELKTIATAIVKAQEQEIDRMNTWRKDWYGAPSPAGGIPTT